MTSKPLGLSKPKPKAATAINTKSELIKKADPLHKSKEARVQKPESKIKEIRGLQFDGPGTYTVAGDGITCDEPFEAVYDANSKSLQMRSKSSMGTAGSISFGGLNLGTMFGGSNIAIGGRVSINGVEYVQQRQPDGRTVLVPRGTLPVAAAAADEKSKRYDFAENKLALTKLRRLRAAGSVHVSLNAGLPEGADVSLTGSGASQIKLRKLPHVLGKVSAHSSGAASITGGGTACRELSAESSGASRIVNFHGLVDVDASASGASNVFVTAAKDASVAEDRSGMASVTVVRA